MLFNETFFGLILHNQLKRWPAFQYPEERADFVVPDHFKPGYHKEDDSPPTSMTDSHPYLVDWEGSNEEDPDSPIAWSSLKKTMFVSQLMLLTTSVYMGSSIVSPGIPLLAEQFHVGEVPATLSLTLFVLGYAIGPVSVICLSIEAEQMLTSPRFS
jgi:DHA1 family multidrug resistance protein-like MFS transporter